MCFFSRSLSGLGNFLGATNRVSEDGPFDLPSCPVVPLVDFVADA